MGTAAGALLGALSVLGALVMAVAMLLMVLSTDDAAAASCGVSRLSNVRPTTTAPAPTPSESAPATSTARAANEPRGERLLGSGRNALRSVGAGGLSVAVSASPE